MTIFATLPVEARKALARRELARRGLALDDDDQAWRQHIPDFDARFAALREQSGGRADHELPAEVLTGWRRLLRDTVQAIRLGGPPAAPMSDAECLALAARLRAKIDARAAA